MADPRGFLKIKRSSSRYRAVRERLKDYRETAILPQEQEVLAQASRCMDCGTPFCHWSCPIGNYVPEWNDHMFLGNWKEAFMLLEATNNFPEFTGRLCPALCEYSCVLGINDDPVTIRENELSIIERAFKHGLVKPRKPAFRTGKKVAVVGSGPAGLACAAQLNKAGHTVTVFEKDDKIGGILRYGIPDFKLEKRIIDRRLGILKKEGIIFKTKTNIGAGYAVSRLKKDFDAVCLAIGSRVPRDLAIEGRQLKGIHFAMDYLIQANKKVEGKTVSSGEHITAQGKRVVVIGAGDTGADCVGTAHRQGALSVTQIELLPKPPECRSEDYPWPSYPMLLKTSSSHEEGGTRLWSIMTKKFVGEKGTVKRLSCVRVSFVPDETKGPRAKKCPIMKEMPKSDFQIKADMVILALGFLHPEHAGAVEAFGVERDGRGNIATGDDYATSVKGVFSAGDSRRGQSLIVWAIAEGRRAAHHIDTYLTGNSDLPTM
jgi:glutamate synthase (NADPH/NADH) small chain